MSVNIAGLFFYFTYPFPVKTKVCEQEYEKNQDRGKNGDGEHPKCQSNPDGGRAPERCGGGQAFWAVFGILENDARADEADARDDRRHDPGNGGFFLREMGGDDNEQAGTHTNRSIGSEASIFVVPLPLEAYETAQNKGR